MSRRVRPIAAIALAAALAAAGAVNAHAVTGAAPTTTLSALYIGATNVTYTFAGYTLAWNQNCTGVTITFPANTDASGATAVSPAGSVTVAGNTVNYVFATPVAKGQPVAVSIGGITNPSTAVTQTAGSMTFHLVKQKGQALPDEALPTGTYSVVPPYLTLSVSTSAIHFNLTPEVATPSQDVTLSVDSSHPYTVTREIAGDSTLMGLSVTGAASGTFAAGPSALVDQYSATVPWTTTGDADYTANITYTVVQQ